MALRIASWNVNSIRVRLEHVQRWLREAEPDILCLQETKVTDTEFPSDAFSRAGYDVVHSGQKTYNGVAILSRGPPKDVRIGLEGDEPGEDRRFIAATVAGIRIVCCYVPNGKSLDSPSYTQKIQWLHRLRQTLETDCSPQQPLVLCGDFNVARDERDVFDAEKMKNQIHFSEAERAALDEVLGYGLVDSLRETTQEGGLFSWWDYRMGAFRRNRGLRIDYLFITEPLKGRLEAAQIDRTPRGWERPSDHAPVFIDLHLPGTTP